MDTAVALVQTYLRVNGYFTVAEYPVLDAAAPGGPRTLTDLDILAVRLHHRIDDGPDPALGADPGSPDMIVGEVKEGRPRLNPAMRDPAVLEAAFSRFGCCEAAEAPALVNALLRTGRVKAPAGHLIRMVAFGNTSHTANPGAWHTVSLEHVLGYLDRHLQHNWAAVSQTQIKDEPLALLALMEKARHSSARDPRSDGSGSRASVSAKGDER
jgi:hypothetical protein